VPRAAASWTTVAVSDRFSSGKLSCAHDEWPQYNRPVYALPTYFVFLAFIMIRIVRAKKIAGIMPRINNKYKERTTELEKFANAEQLVAPNASSASASRGGCIRFCNNYGRKTENRLTYSVFGFGGNRRATPRLRLCH
jgi:hypothetical protein